MSSGGPEEAITTGAYTLGYIIFIVLIQIWFNFKNAQAVCNGSAQKLIFSSYVYIYS